MIKGKKIVTAILAMALGVSALTGCGSQSKELNLEKDGEKALITVDEENISLWDANFQLRLLQLQYESMYGTDIWSQQLQGDETFDTTLKTTVMDGLKNTCVTLSHAKDYQVELTEDETKEAQTQAGNFAAQMTDEFQKITNADKDKIASYVTKMALAQKVSEEIVKEADINVTDEDARQMKANYVVIQIASNAEEAEKTKALKKAKQLVKNTKASGELAQEAKKMDLEVSEATYGNNNTQIPVEIIEASMKLKKGEVTSVIETEYGYYVIQCEEYMDKEATAAAKEEMINEKKSTYYNEQCEKWLKAAKVEVNDEMWEKVLIIDNPTIATTEATTAAESTTAAGSETTTQEGTTASGSETTTQESTATEGTTTEAPEATTAK